MTTPSDSVHIDYTAVDQKVDAIIKIVCEYVTELSPKVIEMEIKKAYEFAKKAHHGVMRLSWEPYISHPVEATEILLSLTPDIHTIQACILHDVIEDTQYTYEDILAAFGSEVAKICQGMTKLSKVKYFGEEHTIGSLRKMFISMSEDIRVIFVKLSDRLHNMRTLHFHPKKEKRERIAAETLNIYTPIADRLGLHAIKNMLDEECFATLYPEDFARISKEIEDNRKIMDAFSKNAKKEIDILLKDTNIQYQVQFRIKSKFSIYKKMLRKNIAHIADLYDVYGIKILVRSVQDCYNVFGLVHGNWTPLPKRVKDYIALPKPNGYQSLHTTVIGILKEFRSQPTEIQIKTFAMERHSNIGIAAHFEYKEKGSKIAKDIDWVEQLSNVTQNLGNSDFLSSLTVDIFKDRIFVLTPKGKSLNLPVGSTPVDFAYEIHTDIGSKIALAKINGLPSPLDTALKNGDVVEITTNKNKTPNPFHLGFVKTTKARNSIRAYIRNQDREHHIERGKELLNNLLQKAGSTPLDKDLTDLKNIDGKVNSTEDRHHILEQIGNLSTSPTSIARKILKNRRIIPTTLHKKWEERIPDIPLEERKIFIGGETDIPYQIDADSKPLNEKIIAYINSKGVITVYNRDSEKLKDLPKERLLSAYFEWDQPETMIFDVSFVFLDRIGVLKKLSDILFEMSIDVLSITSTRINFEKTKIALRLELQDYDYLIIDRFIERVQFRMNDLLESVELGQIENL